MSIKEHFRTIKSLGDYIKTLPPKVLSDLFNSPPSCLAIFRELPKLAQHYVLRILYVEQAVPQAVITTWVSKSFNNDHLSAIEALTSLHVWNDVPLPGGLSGWILNEAFRHNLKIGLLGGSGSSWTQSYGMEPDPKGRTVADLDAYALLRWESILYYLAETEKSHQSELVSKDTVDTLVHAKLMDHEPNRLASITNEGFQFLLLDTASQVWYFMVKYLETIESRKLNLSECLAFLFSISFDSIGKDYSTNGLSEGLQQFMQHLREFGFIYQRSRKAGRFYPTRLAINFFSRKRKIALNTEKHKTGFIVVETNYRLYAYSDSELQLALVGMFTEFLYRLPNLVVGVLSRDSVRQALRNGITADQIITFLKMHAHDEMLKTSGKSSSPLPPSVIDQIRLWEIERDRLKYTPSALYNQFLSHHDYEVVREFAERIGVLANSNDSRRTIVVYLSGHEEVRKFWKKHSKSS